MRRRSDGEQVENCVFAESVPARFEKTRFRFPAVRQQRRVLVEHPSKVDAFVYLSSQTHDFLVARKLLTDCQYTGQQERRVD